jgi:MT-A70/Helix-turn-helix domain
MGNGYWTRANPEDCWLCTRGNPKRLYEDVRQLIVAPVMEHSRKPDEVYERIERLVEGPYLELYARRERPGWVSWGAELPFKMPLPPHDPETGEIIDAVPAEIAAWSVDALTWAKKQKTGSPAKKCVLMTLADYSDEDCVCWPSQETLATVTEQSIDSVQRQLKQLEDDALIKRRGRGVRNGRRAVTIYTLLMPGVVEAPASITPQTAAPQTAASPITTPQIAPNDTAQLCGKNRQLEQIEIEGGPRDLSTKALDIADQCFRAIGHESGDLVNLCGLHYQIDRLLTAGHQADALVEAFVHVTANYGQDKPLIYVVKAMNSFLSAMPAAPLPTVGTHQTRGNNGTYRNGGLIHYAIDLATE